MKFTRGLFLFLGLCLAVLFFPSCLNREYRLFRTDHNSQVDSIQQLLKEDNPVFTIRKNDIIELNVYSSKGERLIDPDQEFSVSKDAAATPLSKVEQFLVQKDGSVFLPMIGRVQLDGVTIQKADSLLAVRYNEYYKDAFVKTSIVNKRIIVIGPLGAKVIKLENEDVNLIEAMALYGGLTMEMRTDCIRVLRGNMANPDVQVVNLSTIDGMRHAQHKLLPGDVVYIEPIKRVFRETMTDILPSISLVVSLLTLLVLINR